MIPYVEASVVSDVEALRVLMFGDDRLKGERAVVTREPLLRESACAMARRYATR